MAYVKASTCLIVKWSAILLVPTREPPLLTYLPSLVCPRRSSEYTSFQIFDTSPSLAADTVAKYRAVATPIERCRYMHQKTAIDSARAEFIIVMESRKRPFKDAKDRPPHLLDIIIIQQNRPERILNNGRQSRKGEGLILPRP